MRDELEPAYAAETARLVRQRLAIVAPLFVALMGTGIVFEMVANPARRRTVLLFWVLESAAAVLAALVVRAPGLERIPGFVGALLTGTIAGLITLYNVQIGGHAERVAMTVGALLNGLAVLLPWGARVQAAGVALAIVTFAVQGPSLATTADSWTLSLLAVCVAGVTSVFGAFFLDRYRFEAFRRSSLHAEEAEVAATLLKVTETLSAHLGKDDMLAQVNRLAVDAVGCDWSSIFVFDDARGVYRLAANVGSTPEVLATLEQLEFAPASLPLLQSFRAGTLVEIHDPDDQTLVPPSLLLRTGVASALYAPIGRGDQIVGVLVNGYRDRRGRFSPKQSRLTLGIAHATAVALENSRLIVDLQTASRLKSDFVATMSHELRTPLNVIMGYSEMLSEDLYEAGSEPWRETLGRIQHASVELMDLISATLDMGRLEAGREAVTLRPVSLGRILGEVARELGPLVPPGVVLRSYNGLGDESITTDGAKVKTIVKNLVGNALKFTPHGSVEMTARGEGDVVVLAVRDTGIGIAAEHLPVIFEMFRQVDGSTTRRFGGVGLGLHIVKHLVTLLGGSIGVESAPGKGSTFTVTIPVGRATPQRATGT